MRVALGFVLVLASSVASVFGCGGDDDSSCTEPADAGDTRFKPKSNGQHTAEDVACEAFRKAIDDKLKLFPSCIATVPLCPQFLRSGYGEGKEYDQGTIDGCIAFYQSKTSCEEVRAAPGGCALTVYPTPKPKKTCP